MRPSGRILSSTIPRRTCRTSILRLNYRNTVEILHLAMLCARQLLDEADETDTQMQRVHPASAGRRGPLPVLLRFASV